MKQVTDEAGEGDTIRELGGGGGWGEVTFNLHQTKAEYRSLISITDHGRKREREKKKEKKVEKMSTTFILLAQAHLLQSGQGSERRSQR